MSSIILFTDLDDTLFNSCRKTPPTADSQALAFLQDGSPISYADRKQQQWLQHWLTHSRLIPVTARNLDSFRRVNIAFKHHAVINYGGIILLPNGSIDEDWFQRSENAARGSHSRLKALADSLRQLPTTLYDDLHIRLISDMGISFYLLVKSRSQHQAHLEQAAACLRSQLLPAEQLHLNANNLAVLPPWLDKSQAVEELLRRFRKQDPDLLCIGMGDSLIDLAFMHCCDYLITPQGSQISAAIKH